MQSSFPSTDGASQVKCSEGAAEWDNARRPLLGSWPGASGAPSERIPIDTNYPGFRCAHPGLSYNAASRLKARISRAKPLASQQHSFHFEIDQSYLNLLVAQCQTILKTDPIRGSQQVRHR